MLPRNSCTKGNFASANIYINKKDAQMKKYLIMSLAMAACSVMVSGCATDGSAGEDTDGGIQETPVDAHGIPEGTTEPVIQESIVQEPFSETEDIGNSDADSADVTDSADTAYNGILDMFYYKIMGGWDHTEDVSYMFYWDYTSVKDLSDAGYALTDLDGNGVPELLVSTTEAAEEGLIYDLYTLRMAWRSMQPQAARDTVITCALIIQFITGLRAVQATVHRYITVSIRIRAGCIRMRSWHLTRYRTGTIHGSTAPRRIIMTGRKGWTLTGCPILWRRKHRISVPDTRLWPLS